MNFNTIPGLITCVIPEGSTEEEKIEIMHQFAVDSDRRYKEKERIRLGLTPEIQRIGYDYKSKLGMEDKDIPIFMKLLFVDGSIETSQKDIFAEQFCPLYFNDEQYRIDNEGKYIFIEDNKIKGIINSMFDFDTKSLTNKLLIKIGKQDNHYAFHKGRIDSSHNQIIQYDPSGEILEPFIFNTPKLFSVECF